MVIWADILEAAVLHAEALRYGAKLHKSEALVKVAGMDIALHHGIELQNTEAVELCLLKAVKHQLLTDMEPARPGSDRVACIADMAASSDIVGMENIQTEDFAVFFGDAGIALGSEKTSAAFGGKELLLRKRGSFLDYLVPDPDQIDHVRRIILSDQGKPPVRFAAPRRR